MLIKVTYFNNVCSGIFISINTCMAGNSEMKGIRHYVTNDSLNTLV